MSTLLGRLIPTGFGPSSFSWSNGPFRVQRPRLCPRAQRSLVLRTRKRDRDIALTLCTGRKPYCMTVRHSEVSSGEGAQWNGAGSSIEGDNSSLFRAFSTTEEDAAEVCGLQICGWGTSQSAFTGTTSGPPCPVACLSSPDWALRNYKALHPHTGGGVLSLELAKSSGRASLSAPRPG